MTQGVTGLLLTNSPLEVGLFQARLDHVSATQAKLNGKGGNYIEVQGVLMDLAASSVDYTITTTDNRIDSTGADAGAAMTTSTLYYLYASNNKASYAPGRLRASATAPTTTAGVKYLGTSGNALNWRFVGWVRTNVSTQFTDSDTSRLVASYYNRKSARLFTCPGYSNGDTATTWTTTSTTWTNANGGTGHQVAFIANGEDSVRLTANGHTNGSATFNLFGAQLDATGGAVVGAKSASSVREDLTRSYVYVPAEGYRTIEMVVAVTAGTGTWEADQPRAGATVDPYATYLDAEVMI